MVNGRRMDERMMSDIITQYARIGKRTKRLFRQQSVTRRREGSQSEAVTTLHNSLI